MNGPPDRKRPAQPGQGGGPLKFGEADCHRVDEDDDNEPRGVVQEDDNGCEFDWSEF